MCPPLDLSLSHSLQRAPRAGPSQPINAGGTSWDSPPDPLLPTPTQTRHKLTRAAAAEIKPVPMWLEMETVTPLFPFHQICFMCSNLHGSPLGWFHLPRPRQDFGGQPANGTSSQHHPTEDVQALSRHCPSHTLPWLATAFSVYGGEAEAHGDGVKPLGIVFF